MKKGTAEFGLLLSISILYLSHVSPYFFLSYHSAKDHCSAHLTLTANPTVRTLMNLGLHVSCLLSYAASYHKYSTEYVSASHSVFSVVAPKRVLKRWLREKSDLIQDRAQASQFYSCHIAQIVSRQNESR
jgi:hypothetical protein